MAPALRHARRGAVLGILAALLLANPLYVGLLVDEPRSRSPTGYTATVVDPTNASDQRLLIDRLGDEEVVGVDQLAEQRQYNPYGPRYRAPGKAAALIRQARDGPARTTNESAAFTLHRLDASHRFVAFPDGEARYFELAVTDENESTVVTLSPADRAAVARHVVYADARLYTSLPEYQRETVNRVVAAADYGYRPYNDEFVDLTDDLLVRNDTYYVFTESVHVDDFGPTTRTLVSVGLSVLGLLTLLAAVVFTSRAFRSSDAPP